MVKVTQRGRRVKGDHRTTSDDEQPPNQAESSDPPSSRFQRTRDFTRSAVHKGAHDSLAMVVGAVLLALLASIVSLVGAHYFGYELDFRGWMSGKQMITGSIKMSPPTNSDAVKKEVDCRVKRELDINRLIDRRKFAWGQYDKCKVDWQPNPDLKQQTAEEMCAPHLVLHRLLAQEVRDRQAKDECTTLVSK
jgi:hypothetical protein